MPTQWKEYVELPESRMGTPLRARNPVVDNLQQLNDKKRGPTTPLTPTLIQRNIVKKQYFHQTESSDHEEKLLEFKDDAVREESQGDMLFDSGLMERQENEENSIFKDKSGSPKSRRSSSTPLGLRESSPQYNTPKISAGIKQAVKDHKKSRLHILRATAVEAADTGASDSEYSEMSSISGDTPSYKLRDNLIYYKNGYYLNKGDDSFADYERDAIVNEKELDRMKDLVDFMKMERSFERE